MYESSSFSTSLLPIVALAGVAQRIENQPVNQNITDLILLQVTCLGCGPGPHLGACERLLIVVCPAYQCFSSSLSPFLPLSLKIKAIQSFKNVNIYIPKVGQHKSIQQILTNVKGEIDSNITRALQHSLPSMDRSFRGEINKLQQKTKKHPVIPLLCICLKISKTLI